MMRIEIMVATVMTALVLVILFGTRGAMSIFSTTIAW